MSTETKHTPYDKGFRDGVRAFAWWKEGEQFVGTAGYRLSTVMHRPESVVGYEPPDEADLLATLKKCRRLIAKCGEDLNEPFFAQLSEIDAAINKAQGT